MFKVMTSKFLGLYISATMRDRQLVQIDCIYIENRSSWIYWSRDITWQLKIKVSGSCDGWSGNVMLEEAKSVQNNWLNSRPINQSFNRSAD